MFKKIQQWFNLSPTNIQAYNPLDDDEEKNSADKNILSHNSEKSVKDTDLEFLFHQLLEGVVNGWQENRIEQFFEKLQPTITVEIWLEWLQRYRVKLLSSPAPHYHFAARMIILGEITASLPFLRAVGDLAYEMGKELLNRAENNPLVESLRSHINSDSQVKKITINDPYFDFELDDTPHSLGDVLSLLQKDPAFTKDAPRQSSINTTTSENIIEKIQPHPSLKESTSPERVHQLFNLGLEKASHGDLKQAIAYWDEALTVDPTFTQAWHNRGSALAYLNHFQEAIISFDQAIAFNVNYYQSWNDRGNALYNLQRWQEAIISWDRVLGLQPNDYQAWYHRGLALEKLQLADEAITSYEKSLSINPDYSSAKHRLKLLYQKKT